LETSILDKDIVSVWRTVWPELWRQRIRLLAWTCLGLASSLILAFILPIRYTSTIKLLPELQPTEAGNLRQFQELAESFNISLDTKTQVEAIRPDLYPDILESAPFALSALHQPVVLQSGQQLRLYKLITQSSGVLAANPVATMPLPTQQPLRLSTDQQELLKDLQTLVKADLNAKTGIMTVSAHMPDPEVAAQVVQFAANYLQTYVRQYRTQKARQDEEFLQHQMVKARQAAYDSDERMLASFDQTRFVLLPSANLGNRRLAEQQRLAAQLYEDLAREHAKARIKVQTVTPVFKILEPAQVPDRRSWPKRKWIVLAGSLSGLALGVLVLLFRQISFLPPRL
jgi:uncharacterized protein involved in exopolysaccharide biosynthesis